MNLRPFLLAVLVQAAFLIYAISPAVSVADADEMSNVEAAYTQYLCAVTAAGVINNDVSAFLTAYGQHGTNLPPPPPGDDDGNPFNDPTWVADNNAYQANRTSAYNNCQACGQSLALLPARSQAANTAYTNYMNNPSETNYGIVMQAFQLYIDATTTANSYDGPMQTKWDAAMTLWNKWNTP